MSRKKTVKASESISGGNDSGRKAGLDAVIKHGIWGLVYLSIGVLLLISILFYSPKQTPNSTDVHILGWFLGTSLASGMFCLFGRITAFAFALAVCYIGAAKLRGRVLRLKLLLFIAILMAELCLMLAICCMPDLAGPEGKGPWALAKDTGSNFVGLLMASALAPLFGKKTFGPYFITSTLMAITVVVGLRVRPQSVAAAVSRRFVAAMLWIRRAFAEVKVGIENSPDIRQATGDGRLCKPEPEGAAVKDDSPRGKKPAGIKAAATPVPAAELSAQNALSGDGGVDGGVVGNGVNADFDNRGGAAETTIPDDDPDRELTPEEEAKKNLEDELSAFRKKRREPIQILTVLTEDVEPDDSDEGAFPPVDGSGFGDGLAGDIDAYADEDGGDEVGAGFSVAGPSESAGPYEVPSPDVLEDPPPLSDMYDQDSIENNSAILEKTLMHFKVEGKVRFVSPGPVVTRYEIELAPGVKISRITSLHDDLSMALGGQKIRIQAPIPGKAAVGIEVPNEKRQNVYFKHVFTSDNFRKGKFDLPVVVGSNISGVPFVTDITKTPHMLIAGQTGSGKSVCLNSLICTLLMTKTPEELRLIMIDPKQVEFNSYENIPHLLSPVVTESKEAVKALQWGVMEMERRYALLKKAGARKIDDFNAEFEAGRLEGVLSGEDHRRLPFVVIIIDELADLMMTAPKDVETLIARITQKARAAGMHLIVATQRPSVNVITGIIKANLPSRIAFRTVSSIDSRTILDQGGAEGLLGMGDMLFLRNGAPDIERFHGAFIPDKDVNAIVAAIREQAVTVDTIGSFNDIIKDPDDDDEGGGAGDGKRDERFAEAARIVTSLGLGSTSLLQRKMEIGFAKAGRIMDQLERAGVVGPAKGSKAREVLMRPEDLDDVL